jgi:hypothetical protein
MVIDFLIESLLSKEITAATALGIKIEELTERNVLEMNEKGRLIQRLPFMKEFVKSCNISFLPSFKRRREIEGCAIELWIVGGKPR